MRQTANPGLNRTGTALRSTLPVRPERYAAGRRRQSTDARISGPGSSPIRACRGGSHSRYSFRRVCGVVLLYVQSRNVAVRFGCGSLRSRTRDQCCVRCTVVSRAAAFEGRPFPRSRASGVVGVRGQQPALGTGALACRPLAPAVAACCITLTRHWSGPRRRYSSLRPERRACAAFRSASLFPRGASFVEQAPAEFVVHVQALLDACLR